MASFPTGNNFTLVISGTFHAPTVYQGDNDPSFPELMIPPYVFPTPPGYTGPYWHQGNTSGFDPAGALYWNNPSNPSAFYHGAPTQVYTASFALDFTGLLVGPVPAVTHSGVMQYTDPFGRVIYVNAPAVSPTADVAVSYSLSVPVHEYADFSFQTLPVPGVFRNKYLVVPAGSVFTISYTNSGGTVSTTSSATPSDVVLTFTEAELWVFVQPYRAVGLTAAATLTCNGAPYTFSRTQSYSVPQTLPNGTQIFFAESATYDYTNGIAVTTTGGGYNNFSTPGATDPPTRLYGYGKQSGHGASFVASHAKKVTLSGTMYGFGGGIYTDPPQNADFACKGSGPFVLVPMTPSCAFNYTQRAGSISEWVYTDVYSINEFGPIWANVDPSINLVGDIPDPILGRDVTFDSMTIHHLPSLVIDDFNGAVPGAWTSSGATVTTTSYTSIAATAGGASGTYTYSGTVPSLEAYRFANVVLNTQVGSNVPLTIAINGKNWAVTSGTAGMDKTIQIDLCCPTSQDGSASGSEDTAYPRVSYPSGTSITDSAHGGVTGVKKFEVSAIPNGETVQVKSLTGVRTTRANLDASMQGNGPYFAFDSGPSVGARLLLAEVDGAQGLEVLGNVAPGTSSFVDISLSGMVSAINGFPGWAAVDLAPSHVYYNNNLPAGSLYGAYNSGVVNKDVTGVTTLQATALFRTADTYPGDDAGNTLNFILWERGEMHGLTLDSSGQPVTGATVTTSPNGGSATSDSLAYFQCGTPWLRPAYGLMGGVYTIVQSGQTGEGILRKKTRALGAPSGTGKNPWNLEHVNGRYSKVDIESGNVVFYGSDHSVPLPGWAIVTPVTSTGDCVDPRIAWDHRGILYLVYARASMGSVGVYTRMSWDFGSSWSSEEPLGITNGYHPTICATQVGIVFTGAFIYNSGTSGDGTLWGQLQFAGDPTTAPFIPSNPNPFQLLDNTGPPGAPLAVADDTFHVQLASDSPMRWLLVCRPSGASGTVDFESWDYCQTWTQVP